MLLSCCSSCADDEDDDAACGHSHIGGFIRLMVLFSEERSHLPAFQTAACKCAQSRLAARSHTSMLCLTEPVMCPGLVDEHRRVSFT